MNRVIRATRLYLIAWPGTVAGPWAILLSAFVINLMIFAALRGHVDSPFTGGLASVYIMVMLVFVQAMGRQFSFALGFSLTRRTYYLATIVFSIAQALVFAVALYLLRLLENATDGWGVNLPFYGVRGTAIDNPLGQIAAYAAPFILLAALGTLVGAIYSRWGSRGLFVAGILTILGGGLAAALVTYWRVWADIGAWFTDQSRLALLAGWPVVLAVAVSSGAYLIIRRATP